MDRIEKMLDKADSLTYQLRKEAKIPQNADATQFSTPKNDTPEDDRTKIRNASRKPIILRALLNYF